MSNTENKLPETISPSGASGAEVNGVPVITRRRLFKAGLTAAPVAMTLASRPVLAWHCSTPSAFGSINRSRPLDCRSFGHNGKAAKQWGEWSSWPSSCNSLKWAKLKDIEAGCFSDSAKKEKMVMEVLTNKIYEWKKVSGTWKWVQTSTSTGATNLDRCLLAAYLNIKASFAPAICLPHAEIKAMCKNGPSGTYKPKAGSPVSWNSGDICDFLLRNWLGALNDWTGADSNCTNQGFLS